MGKALAVKSAKLQTLLSFGGFSQPRQALENFPRRPSNIVSLAKPTAVRLLPTYQIDCRIGGRKPIGAVKFDKRDTGSGIHWRIGRGRVQRMINLILNARLKDLVIHERLDGD